MITAFFNSFYDFFQNFVLTEYYLYYAIASIIIIGLWRVIKE